MGSKQKDGTAPHFQHCVIVLKASLERFLHYLFSAKEQNLV